MNEEILAWEQEQHEKAVRRFFKTEKNYVDPRKEALIRHRHRAPWHRYNETKVARKITEDRFRMHCKTLLVRGDDHAPVPHEYKTYGWETW